MNDMPITCERLILVLLLCCCIQVAAQKEASIWYFGENIGLDFSQGSPIALTNSAMVTVSACAVANSPSGELLFYSNGETVWNKNHQIMQNGSDLTGKRDAGQSVLIVPIPSQNSKFYLFTLSDVDVDTPYSSLYYSIIDLNMEGGLGAITKKNILLVDHMTQKQTAVKHANGKDIWLIAHEMESDVFLTFLISETGIETPNKYAIGSKYFYGTVFTGSSLRASPNGLLLATGMNNYRIQGDFNKGPVELFDFDPASGIISNYRNLGDLQASTGVSFSPDNTKLYVAGTDTEFLESTGDDSDVIYQWDLTDPDVSKTIASRTPLFSSKNTVTNIGKQAIAVGGDLALAPDGKLYAAGNITIADANGAIVVQSRNTLFVIERPNAKGFDSYVTIKSFNFGTGKVRVGLPNFMQHFFNNLEPIDEDKEDPSLCNSSRAYSVYPNPFKDSFQINLNSECGIPSSISLHTVLGQKILHQSVYSRDPIILEVDGLAQGVYLLTLEFQHTKIAKKLIKQ